MNGITKGIIAGVVTGTAVAAIMATEKRSYMQKMKKSADKAMKNFTQMFD